MKTLTIFTPTYNRAHTLTRTYQSLSAQTCKDFEWLIIDDGSTDNTSEIVKQWISEADFKIRYIHQENQGMHGAHNTAYQNITTELNTCIDSDDYMPIDAVENIVSFWNKNRNNKYAGIVGLDITRTGENIGSPFKVKATTLTDYYDLGGKGDKKIVYRTDIIHKYPDYPIFKNEKYVSLASKYFLIDQDFKLLTLNKPLVIVEYQYDGSSINMYRQYWNNPQGFIYDRKLVLSHNPKLKKKIKYCIHYISSKLIAQERFSIISDSPKPITTLLVYPLGYLLYYYIKYKVHNNKKMNIK